MDISDGNLMFSGDELYFGYWEDAVYKKTLNPQLVYTKSESINTTQSLNVLVDDIINKLEGAISEVTKTIKTGFE
jgi:hypothetical protein